MIAAIARLKDAKPEDFADIYAIITGGEPCRRPCATSFKQRFDIPLFEGYGLTETSPVIAINVPQPIVPAAWEDLCRAPRRRIVDDNGKALPPGQIGEIWLKGPMIMKGYHNLPKETAEVLTPDGYFKTGDLGSIDPDGFLYITGRKKDMIIVAGEKAYPREIEDVLLRHPAVHEAAVSARKTRPRRSHRRLCLPRKARPSSRRTSLLARIRSGPVESAAGNLRRG